MPSDRFITDWELRTGAGFAAVSGRPGAVAPGPVDPGVVAAIRPGELRVTESGSWLGVPADWRAFRHGAPGEALGMRELVVGQAEQLLADGLAGVSCRRLDDQTAVYRFARRERP